MAMEAETFQAIKPRNSILCDLVRPMMSELLIAKSRAASWDTCLRWVLGGFSNTTSSLCSIMEPLSVDVHNFTSPDVKFSVAPSSKGGMDIEIGSDTIHVPKYFSAHHPLVQMLLFAEVKWDGFYYPKSLALKSIVKMFEKPRTSDSPNNVYEAGWVSASHPSVAPDAGFAAVLKRFIDGDDRDNKPPVPVLFDMMSEKNERISTVSAVPPARDHDGFVLDIGASGISQDETSTKASDYLTHVANMSSEYIPKTAYSVDHPTDSTITLHERAMEGAGDSDFGILYCNGTSAVTSSEETTLVPMVHEREETALEHHSAISAVAAEAHRVIAKTEEAKASATWVVATAAPHHATGNLALITAFKPQQDELFVHAADGTPMQVLGYGNVVTDTVVLPDVWYVPGLTANLVSVSQLADLDYSVGFVRAQCCIRSAADGGLVGSARVGDEGLFVVDFLQVPLLPRGAFHQNED